MAKRNTGINNPNAAPIIRVQKEGWSDGKKALAYALIGFTAITANFGFGRALQGAADSIYEGGYFKDGIYIVDKPGVDAVFYCNDGGTVSKEDTIID